MQESDLVPLLLCGKHGREGRRDRDDALTDATLPDLLHVAAVRVVDRDDRLAAGDHPLAIQDVSVVVELRAVNVERVEAKANPGQPREDRERVARVQEDPAGELLLEPADGQLDVVRIADVDTVHLERRVRG